MTVCACCVGRSKNNLTDMIIPIITSANGIAFEIAVFKKRPFTFLVSDSKIVRKDGHASIAASINVICIGINGNGILITRQKIVSKTE